MTTDERKDNNKLGCQLPLLRFFFGSTRNHYKGQKLLPLVLTLFWLDRWKHPSFWLDGREHPSFWLALWLKGKKCHCGSMPLLRLARRQSAKMADALNESLILFVVVVKINLYLWCIKCYIKCYGIISNAYFLFFVLYILKTINRCLIHKNQLILYLYQFTQKIVTLISHTERSAHAEIIYQ